MSAPLYFAKQAGKSSNARLTQLGECETFNLSWSISQSHGIETRTGRPISNPNGNSFLRFLMNHTRMSSQSMIRDWVVDLLAFYCFLFVKIGVEKVGQVERCRVFLPVRGSY